MLPALARSLRTKKASSVAFESLVRFGFREPCSLPNRYENHIAAVATSASTSTAQSRNLKKKRVAPGQRRYGRFTSGRRITPHIGILA
jgi:hypothetical protein